MPRDRRRPYDVAIVGLGPTGAVLAGLAGLRGLRVAVLGRERESCACRVPSTSTAR